TTLIPYTTLFRSLPAASTTMPVAILRFVPPQVGREDERRCDHDQGSAVSLDMVMVASPEQGRENERRAYGIQLSHERVLGTVKRFLEGAGRGPKVGRIG